MTPVIIQNEAFPYLLVALAAWRASHLLMYEVGPWKLLTRFRALFGVVHNADGTVLGVPDGSLFACFWCFSVWIGIAWTVIPWWASVPFALSAAAILTEGPPNGKS